MRTSSSGSWAWVTMDRTTSWIQGLAGVDMVHYGLAEYLDEEEKQGTWKEYTYSPDFPIESKQGTHPRTFGSFLEGHSFDLRASGQDISRGQLADLLALYRWFTAMGGNQQTWAYLGRDLLKRIYRQHRDPTQAAPVVAAAIASKEQHGKVFLPSFTPEGRVTTGLEVESMGDGTFQIRALVLTKDGIRYANRFTEQLLHWLSKRLRASIIYRDGS